MNSNAIISSMIADARESDRLRDRARELLRASVRAGAAAGLTQKEIAEAVGRSQPEVSRLLRFHGRTPLALAVQRNRAAILRTLSDAGARNPRVFGSVSRGDDGPDSDVDLLVDFDDAVSLFDLARLEAELALIVGSPVDVAVSDGLREHVAARVTLEAVPL